jgi:tetratricopeptide (TPR) repeat protein
MKEKKPDAAIQTLTDARMKFPSEAEVTYALGVALGEAKHYQEALSTFEDAEEEASTGQTEMLDAQFYFSYAAAAEQAGQVDKAFTLFKKSIDLDPESSAEALNYIGFMWVDRGLKLDEAAGYIKKALQMDPNNPAYIDSLGWYYFKKGQYPQAVTLLKKAAKTIQPEDAIVDEHLGDAYSALNDTANALDYWQKASAIDKENKEIAVKIAGARQKLAKQSPPAPAPQ